MFSAYSEAWERQTVLFNALVVMLALIVLSAFVSALIGL